ncbi:amidohydrolase [Arthrobacter sp. ISL-30]|uniref:amidohydrolase n=1 Tax=Arthrobacter sp. ISL-30 TaxID=2819109 RepID=UPI001BE96431|nr:amidohydrolase [Arthrobacter sp. ISL-30]MBT2512279.1 amidohydrolase [Arthrobacter sp. ISL-30]
MTPDLILLADTIHTMDAQTTDGGTSGTGGTAVIEAIAVRNGVITAVGTRKEAAGWQADEVIDFGNAAITPGLVDCHIHPVFGLELTRGRGLSGARNLAEMRAMLQDEAAATGPGEWVRAWGLDPNIFGMAQAHRELIDDVASGKPCLIRLLDGHSALAGSRALELAGINGPAVFDQAAEVVCDGNGRPTGLLLEAAAVELVTRVVPRESFQERKARLAELLGRFSRAGLTGAHVMDLGEGSFELYRAVEEEALENDGGLPLKLRISPWCMPGTGEEDWQRLAEFIRQGGRRWEIAGIKLFVDGTVDNGTAWLFEPDIYGASTTSFWPRPEEYAAAVRFFASRGIPTSTHAIGDAGVACVLDAFEALPADTPRAVHRIEHLETVPDELVDRLARSGLVASMQPTHCTHYASADHTDNWSTRLGAERANNGWRCADLRSAGIPLGLGSDWPIAPFEPLPIMADAQLRRRAGHPAEQPIVPGQGLTAIQALEGYTSHAARAAGEEEISGSITVGKRADFTVFDVDPLAADPDRLAHAQILATVVDGKMQHLALDIAR